MRRLAIALTLSVLAGILIFTLGCTSFKPNDDPDKGWLKQTDSQGNRLFGSKSRIGF